MSYSVIDQSIAYTKVPIAETYMDLWCSDSTWQSAALSAQNPGTSFLVNNTISSSGAAGEHLVFTANWSQDTKVALEATLYGNVSSITSRLALWDLVTNSIVDASQVFAKSTTAKVVRSNQFTLIPGRSYALTIWGSFDPDAAYCTDASLIIFG